MLNPEKESVISLACGSGNMELKEESFSF